VDFGFFTSDDGETLHPSTVAQSLWSETQIHGVAVSGALARGMERSFVREDLRPARWTVDLFKAASMAPTTVETEVLREGPRIALVESRLVQDGDTRARATAVWLKPTTNPDGVVWTNPDVPQPPALDLLPPMTGPDIPWFASDNPWSQDFSQHKNSGRHTNWLYCVPIVVGEETSPFQAAAAVADSTSMVVNWSDKGVEWINTDINLHLSRLPRTPEMGLRVTEWAATDGIAVGTATVFDRDGVLGVASVTALANNKRTVDFDDHFISADGERTSRV